MKKSEDRPLVSVVIATRNEEENIVKLMESFKKQKFKDFEVVVVDGNSTDRTVETAKKYGAKVFQEYGRHRSLPNARNIGVDKSRGEVIGMMDADVEVDSDFIKGPAEAYLKNKDKFFGAACYTEPCDDTWIARIRKAYIQASEPRTTPLLPFIAAKHRKALGKWDPELGFGEDRHYVMQINEYLKKHKELKTFQTKSVMKLHVTHTIKELLSQQRWYGRTIPFYLKKYGTPRERLTIIKAGYVLILLGLLHPILLILSLPFWLLTLYHTLNALARGFKWGVLIPVLDVLMGIGFLFGLVEYFFSKKRARG